MQPQSFVRSLDSKWLLGPVFLFCSFIFSTNVDVFLRFFNTLFVYWLVQVGVS